MSLKCAFADGVIPVRAESVRPLSEDQSQHYLRTDLNLIMFVSLWCCHSLMPPVITAPLFGLAWKHFGRKDTHTETHTFEMCVLSNSAVTDFSRRNLSTLPSKIYSDLLISLAQCRCFLL